MVVSRYPSLFSFSNFPCPDNPQLPSQQLMEGSSLGGEQILDPNMVPFEAPVETHKRMFRRDLQIAHPLLLSRMKEEVMPLSLFGHSWPFYVFIL